MEGERSKAKKGKVKGGMMRKRANLQVRSEEGWKVNKKSKDEMVMVKKKGKGQMEMKDEKVKGRGRGQVIGKDSR